MVLVTGAQGHGLEGLVWCIWQGVLRRVCEYCVHGGQLCSMWRDVQRGQKEWHFGACVY